MNKNKTRKIHDCQYQRQNTGDKNIVATKIPRKRWLALEKIKKLKTYWFQIDESIFNNAETIDSKFSCLKSVFSYGPQIFDKNFNGRATTCFCYTVTFDTEHVNFKKDVKKTESVKLDDFTLHQCEIDEEGLPIFQPIIGLEFTFSTTLLDERFLQVADLIRSEFKCFAEFYEVDKSLVFIDGGLAKLKIQVKRLLMRPRGRYDLKLESGRRFSVIARSYGVAPKEKQVPVFTQKKICYECGSDQHLAISCKKTEDNKIDESKKVSTPAKTLTKTKSGRIIRKPQRYTDQVIEQRRGEDQNLFLTEELSNLSIPRSNSKNTSNNDNNNDGFGWSFGGFSFEKACEICNKRVCEIWRGGLHFCAPGTCCIRETKLSGCRVKMKDKNQNQI